MALNEIVTTASPEQTFALLLDPYVYPNWVVATKRIRVVDDDWPAPGSRVTPADRGWPRE